MPAIMRKQTDHAWVRFLFFGNYFYGICAVALAVETSLQQHLPLNDAGFYLALFAATVLYYTKAYITDSEVLPNIANPRTAWYAQNRKMVWWSQVVLTIVVAAWLFSFLYARWAQIWQMTFLEWGLLLFFPVVAALYYGVESKQFARFNLRNIGWLKPFVIGCTWAGLVNVYPLLYYNMVRGQQFPVTLVGCLLFVKNFMFVTVLCIMFDIKDYAMDHNRQLKTFVVKAGLRKTIFYIIIPLSAIGLAAFLWLANFRHFSLARILVNTIPFIGLMVVAYSLHRRKNIFYYLIAIDGLMLVKAVCGMVGMHYF